MRGSSLSLLPSFPPSVSPSLPPFLPPSQPHLQLQEVDGLRESEQTVGGEDECLEGVAVAEALWDTLQLVPGGYKVLQTGQLPNGGRDALKVETIV